MNAELKEEKKEENYKQTVTDTNNSYLAAKDNLNFRKIFFETSWKNRSLLAICQAGLVNNLVFGVAWDYLHFILYL